MSANQALWLSAKGGAPEISAAPVPEAVPGQIVVRAAAVAVNPIDWILQSVGGLIFPWLRYPLVLGWDVAGEVTAVGSGVARFGIGDRVVGLAVGQDKAVNDPAEGAFQHHVRLRENMAATIPASLAWEQAVVLPLAISTAASALFQTDQLALAHPATTPSPAGKTLLVWGGSTSVGSNAVQLAVAAGYDVVATASPRNHGYVRQLGASRVFDYASLTVVPDILQALEGKTLAGAIAIGTGSAGPCVDVVGACPGGKFVSMVSPPVSFDDAPAAGGRKRWLARKLFRMVTGNLALTLRARRHGVRTRFVIGSTPLHNEVGRMIFADFLPQALAFGRYRAAPDPLVVGAGLDAIGAALDRQKQGVSARKIVVTL